MTFTLKLNKSKQISFRINPKGTGVDFILTLPGITITLTKRTSKSKSISNIGENAFPVTRVNNANIQQFQSVQYRLLISKISRLLKLNSLSNWLCPIILLAGILLLPLPSLRNRQPITIRSTIIVFSGIIGILGIIIKVYLHTFGKVKLHNYLDLENIHELPVWQDLMNSETLWQIIGITKLPPEDTREHAGSTIWYDRVPVKRKAKAPFYLKVTGPILQLILKNETLILVPGIYILVHKSKVGIIDASAVRYTSQSIAYPETENLPADAHILRYTWKYVNKDGSKDKRYNANVQVPICNYGFIQLKSDSGLNIMLLSSSTSHKVLLEGHPDL